MDSPLLHNYFLKLIRPLPFACSGWNLEKTVVQPIRQVVPRSSIRGFKDDYHYVDTDVVLIEGEVHVMRKPVSIAPRSCCHKLLHDAQYNSLF